MPSLILRRNPLEANRTPVHKERAGAGDDPYEDEPEYSPTPTPTPTNPRPKKQPPPKHKKRKQPKDKNAVDDTEDIVNTGGDVGQGDGGIVITRRDKPYGGLIVYNTTDNYNPDDGTGTYRALIDFAGNITIAGTIIATAGGIGGFVIGADYVEDTNDSFGLASTVTSGDDLRFWAGASFANRTIAPFQVYESGMVFAKDIILAKGSLTNASGETGYGYAVGEPNFLCHFDGPRPYATDYRGSAIGHKGQVDTRSGGVIFRKGMFGKAVQIAEATTNKVLNPSAETTGNFAARGTATVTRDTATYYVGVTSYKVVLAAANDGIDLTLSALANANHYVSFWVTGAAISTLQVSADGTNWNAITQEYSETIDGITWTHCIAAIPQAQANGSTTLRIRNTASSGTFYVDAVQVEQKNYPTPYCDGSLGDGHSWSGTAHASQSSRAAATLTYPFTGNMNFVQGSLTFWARENAVMTGFGTVFAARADANNYLVANLSGGGGSGNLIPYAEFKSGGSGTSTTSGATAIAAGWHHFVVTWQSGALKLYVDGVQNGATVNYVAPLVAPTNIEIGTFNGVNPANTLIDDLAILPYVLSPNEIKSIYYSTAPLMVGISNQEWRLSGAGVGDVWGNAYGIFARDANGNPSFGLFNAAVNTNTFGGANETLTSGSLIFGNNNTGKANLTYDASAGRLNFRGGTTTQAYIDTNGAMMAGGGNVGIDTDGLSFVQGSASTNSIKWKNGSTTYGKIYGTATTAAMLYLTNDDGNHASEGQIAILSNTSSGNGMGTLYAASRTFSWLKNGDLTGGLAMAFGGTLASKSSTTTIANTTTETSCGLTATLLANTASAGDCIKIVAGGFYSTTGTPTMRFRVYLGSTLVATTTVFTPSGTSVTNKGWRVEVYVPIWSVGASGTVFAHGWGTIGRTDIIDFVQTSTTKVDFTANQAIDLRFTWETASTSNSLKCTLLQIEYLTSATTS
jgi:hypothetical protein